MKCESIKMWLVEYVLEEFKKPWLRMVREHISECQTCLKEVNEIRQTFEVMSKVEEIDVPETLYFKLMQRVKILRSPRRIIRFLKEPVPIYSVIAILVGFSIIFMVPKTIKLREPAHRPKSYFSYLVTDTSFSFIPSAAVKTNLAAFR